MWDGGLAKFPPYVTDRTQLGYRLMDIPEEFLKKPAYQSNHYCSICLELMPLICHVCRDDINDQQRTLQTAINEEAKRTLEAAWQLNLDPAHLLDNYNPIHLVPEANDEQSPMDNDIAEG